MKALNVKLLVRISEKSYDETHLTSNAIEVLVSLILLGFPCLTLL
jgi:hypothetical protein